MKTLRKTFALALAMLLASSGNPLHAVTEKATAGTVAPAQISGSPDHAPTAQNLTWNPADGFLMKGYKENWRVLRWGDKKPSIGDNATLVCLATQCYWPLLPHVTSKWHPQYAPVYIWKEKKVHKFGASSRTEVELQTTPYRIIYRISAFKKTPWLDDLLHPWEAFKRNWQKLSAPNGQMFLVSVGNQSDQKEEYPVGFYPDHIPPQNDHVIARLVPAASAFPPSSARVPANPATEVQTSPLHSPDVPDGSGSGGTANTKIVVSSDREKKSGDNPSPVSDDPELAAAFKNLQLSSLERAMAEFFIIHQPDAKLEEWLKKNVKDYKGPKEAFKEIGESQDVKAKDELARFLRQRIKDYTTELLKDKNGKPVPIDDSWLGKANNKLDTFLTQAKRLSQNDLLSYYCNNGGLSYWSQPAASNKNTLPNKTVPEGVKKAEKEAHHIHNASKSNESAVPTTEQSKQPNAPINEYCAKAPGTDSTGGSNKDKAPDLGATVSTKTDDAKDRTQLKKDVMGGAFGAIGFGLIGLAIFGPAGFAVGAAVGFAATALAVHLNFKPWWGDK